MKKEQALQVVKNLPFDTALTVFKEDASEIFLYRPSKLSKRFENYDLKKNFQIWLKTPGREFRPNHLRVMIDLNLRVRSRQDLRKALALAFDNIFYGKDPDSELQELAKETYPHYLNSLFITGHLVQFFIVEQEYCYHKESRYEPPTLFFQGWLREFLDNPKEIDNLCMSVCGFQPPLAKYVNLENKKSKTFRSDLKPLWYLEE